MKCFLHGPTDAVAICQGCGKALCSDCCSRGGPAMVCSEHCERTVAQVRATLDGLYRNAQGSNRAAVVLLNSLAVVALGFAVVVLFDLLRRWKTDDAGYLGLNVFLGVACIVIARRIRRVQDQTLVGTQETK